MISAFVAVLRLPGTKQDPGSNKRRCLFRPTVSTSTPRFPTESRIWQNTILAKRDGAATTRLIQVDWAGGMLTIRYTGIPNVPERAGDRTASASLSATARWRRQHDDCDRDSRQHDINVPDPFLRRWPQHHPQIGRDRRSVRRLAVASLIQYPYPTRSIGLSPGRWIQPLAGSLLRSRFAPDDDAT